MDAALTRTAFFEAALTGTAFFEADFPGAVPPEAASAGVAFLSGVLAAVTFLAVRGAAFFALFPPAVVDAAFDAALGTAFTGADFVAFACSSVPSGPCSPTAESRRTPTRPAPLACALTGDLDTRPA
ncbi:hypothetical protein ACF07B_20175 [Streptomyces sp. NPDC015532]|uniref:hypothetical protein n=1 Tax=Streptomyces sp. NPDC015532 TaxID=3364960 RepID=UPI0036FCF639